MLLPPDRILVIDDNQSIHDAFEKILAPPKTNEQLLDLEADLFGDGDTVDTSSLELCSAMQGQEGLAVVTEAVEQGRPFGMAFVDVRMPPGWDGIETIEHLWAVDPELQVVLCTAYSDYSWEETLARVGKGDRLLILKKPFDAVEVRQLAAALCHKRALASELAAHRRQLEERVRNRTHELEAEMVRRQAAETDLIRAQKLEAVGQLAAGVAHEINTPIQYVGDNINFVNDAVGELLGLVRTYKEAATRHLPLPVQHELAERERNAELDYLSDEVPEALSSSIEGLARVARIVAAMKAYAHPGNGDAALASVNDILRDAVIVSTGEHKLIADVELNLGELPQVVCFSGDLGRVFLNIIVNAAHAIGDENDGRGTIRVSTSSENDHVMIQIGDTGPGIPEHVQPRIFEPFYTTKEVGRGTGQGLAISHAVVTKHGGTLDFETGPQGTTFSITLPINGVEQAA